MKRALPALFLVFVLALAAGCAGNGFTTAYQGKNLREAPDGGRAIAAAPIAGPLEGDARTAELEMFRRGYAPLGEAAWSGEEKEGEKEALEQAENVGADVVLWRFEQTGVAKGVHTYDGFLMLTHVPYEVPFGEYEAVFFAKLPPPRGDSLEISTEPPAEAADGAAGPGALVVAVRAGGKAQEADVREGDVVLRVDGVEVGPEGSWPSAPGVVELEILRDGKILKKEVVLE